MLLYYHVGAISQPTWSFLHARIGNTSSIAEHLGVVPSSAAVGVLPGVVLVRLLFKTETYSPLVLSSCRTSRLPFCTLFVAVNPCLDPDNFRYYSCELGNKVLDTNDWL